jgi:tetratricopeptide (TPR) repeat protein
MKWLCCVVLSILLWLGLTVNRPIEALSLPQQADSHRCLLQLQRQDYLAALSDCREAIGLDPDQAETRLNLGLAYYHLEQYDEALAQFDQLLRTQPQDYRGYYNQGLVYTAQGQLESALSSYGEALRFAPQQPQIQAEIYRDRGAAYLLLSRYGAAIRDLDQAIEDNPSDQWSYFNRGCAYHRSHDFLLALRDFEQVIQQDEQNAQAHWNRGLVLAHLKQTEEAIASLQQAQYYFQIQQKPWARQQIQTLIDQLQNDSPQIERSVAAAVG